MLSYSELLHEVHVALVLAGTVIHAVTQLMVEGGAAARVLPRQEMVTGVCAAHWNLLTARILLLIKEDVGLLRLPLNRIEVRTNQLDCVVVVTVPQFGVRVLYEGVVMALIR